MHNIAVISDTHHDVANLEKIYPILSYCDMVIHLGDGGDDLHYYDLKNVEVVKGNCDIYPFQQYYILDIQGTKLLFLHGDKYNVKYSPLSLYLFAQEKQASYVFYGHTHMYERYEYNGITFINVGSLSKPRDGTPSYVLIHPHENKINISYMTVL